METASNPSSPILIRPLKLDDIDAVVALFQELARKSITFEFTPQGEERLLRSNNADSLRTYIADGFRYWVAECDQTLAGFVGMRGNSHLYHLFVAETFQRRGLARRLWQVARDACLNDGNPGKFTVNSSNNAVAVYEALGFRRTLPMQNVDGVLFNPMILE